MLKRLSMESKGMWCSEPQDPPDSNTLWQELYQRESDTMSFFTVYAVEI